MSDQIAITGEFCTLLVAGLAVAASRNFDLKVDAASYGNFVARGTSKWRTFHAADLGASLDVSGLIVLVDPSPPGVNRFKDLFTALKTRVAVAVVFTLTGAVPASGEFFAIYTGTAILTSLSAAAPQFGEATYSCTMLCTGELVQTSGYVS